jgi:hypothetical protein
MGEYEETDHESASTEGTQLRQKSVVPYTVEVETTLFLLMTLLYYRCDLSRIQ